MIWRATQTKDKAMEGENDAFERRGEEGIYTKCSGS